jgi:hypothetical protein
MKNIPMKKNLAIDLVSLMNSVKCLMKKYQSLTLLEKFSKSFYEGRRTLKLYFVKGIIRKENYKNRQKNH